MNRCHIGSCWIWHEPQTFLSCHFRIFKHGNVDLEHLSTGNKTISLRHSASLSTLKWLIQSILLLIDGFNTETPVWRDLRLRLTLKTLKSIYCEQNTEVTWYIWQLKLQTNLWNSWKPIQKTLEPIVVRDNQLATSTLLEIIKMWKTSSAKLGIVSCSRLITLRK